MKGEYNMGDIYTEYMVVKKPNAVDNIKKLGISIAAILVCAVLFVVSRYVGVFQPFAIMGGLGALYFGWYLMNNLNVEFEVIVTNGGMDVDKIIARRDRKRLISVNCANFEELAKYDPAAAREQGCTTVIKACDSEKSDNVYYGIFRHPSKGKTMVVFNANEKVLAAMKPYVPRNVWGIKD